MANTDDFGHVFGWCRYQHHCLRELVLCSWKSFFTDENLWAKWKTQEQPSEQLLQNHDWAWIQPIEENNHPHFIQKQLVSGDKWWTHHGMKKARDALFAASKLKTVSAFFYFMAAFD